MGTLWTNGTIYTMQAEGHTVEAVWTEDGKVKALGSEAALTERFAVDRKMDLEGKIMFPGFVDSHMHLIGHGETLMRLDLSEMTSKEQVLLAVKEKADRTPEGDWIIGEGWNENLWEDPEVITKDEIDHVAGGHPVLLKRICRHAIVVNTLALEKAGITDASEDPEGGLIDRYDDGRVNGVLKDTAQDIVTGILPSISLEYLEEALAKGVQSCWENGLTGGHTEDLSYYGDFNKTYQAFRNTLGKDGKKFRAHLLVHHAVIEDWHDEGHQFLEGSPYVEFGAMKIFADGALGGRTALLSHPYADDESTSGVSIHTEENLQALVAKARSYDLPIAVHTIGDLAFEQVVDAITKEPTVKGRRDRLIHAQILRHELIERIKGLDLILDIQPRFVASDFPWVIDRIGKDRMKYNYAWKTLLEEGIHCAGGSDAPIEPVNPLLGIHAAVTRTNPVDPDHTVYGPEQVLSMYEGISLFTKGSAFACHHEADRGLIKEGYDADFTILNEDPFAGGPDVLLKQVVAMTVVDEDIVYSRDRKK